MTIAPPLFLSPAGPLAALAAQAAAGNAAVSAGAALTVYNDAATPPPLPALPSGFYTSGSSPAAPAAAVARGMDGFAAIIRRAPRDACDAPPAADAPLRGGVLLRFPDISPLAAVHGPVEVHLPGPAMGATPPAASDSPAPGRTGGGNGNGSGNGGPTSTNARRAMELIERLLPGATNNVPSTIDGLDAEIKGVPLSEGGWLSVRWRRLLASLQADSGHPLPSTPAGLRRAALLHRARAALKRQDGINDLITALDLQREAARRYEESGERDTALGEWLGAAHAALNLAGAIYPANIDGQMRFYKQALADLRRAASLARQENDEPSRTLIDAAIDRLLDIEGVTLAAPR